MNRIFVAIQMAIESNRYLISPITAAIKLPKRKNSMMSPDVMLWCVGLCKRNIVGLGYSTWVG